MPKYNWINRGKRFYTFGLMFNNLKDLNLSHGEARELARHIEILLSDNKKMLEILKDVHQRLEEDLIAHQIPELTELLTEIGALNG